MTHKKHNAAQRGFTLIEVMVVIVIIGVLAALLVPKVMSRPDEAQRLAYLLEQAGASARAGARAGGLPLAWPGNGREFRFWKKTNASSVEYDQA